MEMTECIEIISFGICAGFTLKAMAELIFYVIKSMFGLVNNNNL